MTISGYGHDVSHPVVTGWRTWTVCSLVYATVTAVG